MSADRHLGPPESERPWNVVGEWSRYEICILIGPCRREDAERLMGRIAHYVYDTLGHPFGASISLGPFRDEDPEPR